MNHLSIIRLAAMIIAVASYPFDAAAQLVLQTGIEATAIVSGSPGSTPPVDALAPCAQMYGTASPPTPGFGLFATIELDPRRVFMSAVRLSAGYEWGHYRFHSEPTRFESYDPRNASYTIVETGYQADFAMRYLRVAIEVEALRLGPVILRSGLSLRKRIDGSVQQRETILSPASATFLDGAQDWTIPAGTMADLINSGIITSLVGTVAGRFDAGGGFYLEPAISLESSLGTSEPEWRFLSMRYGLSIGYRHTSAAPAPPVIVAAPDMMPPASIAPDFTGSLSARLSAGRMLVELRHRVEVRHLPLLPMIFFEKNVGKIPSRYLPDSTGDGRDFRESRLPGSAEQTHRALLEIIGSRLAAAPQARLTITGTTSDDESGRGRLAQTRAIAVAEYLIARWEIPSSRIIVRSRMDAAIASSSAYDEGLQENRRVELEIDDDRLYNPVRTEAVEPLLEPDTLRWLMSSDLSRPAKRWALRIEQDGVVLHNIEANGEIPSTLDWSPELPVRSRMLAGGNIRWWLRAWDEYENMVESKPGSVRLRLDTSISYGSSPQYQEGRAEFLLVTFDFDRAVPSARSLRQLEMILERIGPDSKVSITGYTDSTGETTRNIRLALERARTIAARMPPGTRVSLRGAAPNEAPYSSSTPEGRFLSRTVRIVIDNPK